MIRGSNATPLIALDAVVIDSETTGLDPKSARLVEIAAVRLVGGKFDERAPFRRLVRPDVPIPAAASAIHGIEDATVAAAPTFAEVWPELSAFIGGAVVIGHTLGFDLAILREECRRAGLSWARPRSLDTRLLAEVAAPDLAGYSPDQLAAWLGIAVEGRHSALGDATLAARIFLALLPELREGGIRTLAEAEQACRALTDVLDREHRAGWVEAVTAPNRIEAERTLGRIDSYPYRHRVADVMSAPPQIVPPDVSIGSALGRMVRERISSLFVSGESNVPPQQAGIVTERDIMRALAEHGAPALEMPVERIASRPLVTVPADALVYRAIGRMDRLKVRHLGVTTEQGELCGALSMRNLRHLRAEGAVILGDEIERSEGVPELARAFAKLPHLASGLLAEGLSSREIAVLISHEVAELTRRAALFAERILQDSGQGGPPCPYAFVVLGSAGRGESLLAMDQDNALVFAEGAPGGEHDHWFERLSIIVSDILHEVGVPYCPGGVMAKNPQWRGSVATWRERLDGWIRHSSPEDLLSVDIFFDMRSVHGDASLANDLWRGSFEAARGEAGFARLLAEAVLPFESAFNLFGGLRTRQGRIDLKKVGLFGIVAPARILAICHHVIERSTPARLASIKALGLGGAYDLDMLDEAHETFLELILDQQCEDIEHGVQATNTILLKRLSQKDHARLRGALHAVRHVDDLLRDMLFKD